MRINILLGAVLIALLPSAAPANPGTALARARDHISRREFEQALQVLRQAAPEAAVIPNIKERAAALSAIHFYSALALSDMGKEAEAAGELRPFFRYQPSSSLDESGYPDRFNVLFKKVKNEVAHGIENYRSFDDAYPGSGYTYSGPPWQINIWGSSSEFQLLATDAEKADWSKLRMETEQLKFIENFWSVRDPHRATPENELRDQMLSRIAFADLAFGDMVDGRGSLTDRGRVYVLLGKPARLSIRPLNRTEARFAPRRRMSAQGAVEEWTYFRDQIPGKIPAHEVTFRFLNDSGDSQRVLQQEFMPTKALAAAKDSLKRGSEQ